MPSSLRAMGVAVLFLLSGACAHTERPPEEGWPQTPDFSRLPRRALSEERAMDNLVRFQELRGERMYSHEYRQQGLFSHHHSHFITVTWFPEHDEFYVSPNCMMGHMDAPYGPFNGDPRTVLAPAPP